MDYLFIRGSTVAFVISGPRFIPLVPSVQPGLFPTLRYYDVLFHPSITCPSPHPHQPVSTERAGTYFPGHQSLTAFKYVLAAPPPLRVSGPFLNIKPQVWVFQGVGRQKIPNVILLSLHKNPV